VPSLLGSRVHGIEHLLHAEPELREGRLADARHPDGTQVEDEVGITNSKCKSLTDLKLLREEGGALENGHGIAL
jgi:hypothetical protein